MVKLPLVYWLTALVATVLYAFNLTALWRGNLWRRVPGLLAYLTVVFLRDRIYVCGLYFWPFRIAASFYWIGEGVIYVVSFLLVMSIWKDALGRLRGLWVVARWVLPVILMAFLAFVRWNSQFTAGSSRPGDWGGDWLRLLGQNLSLTQALFLLGFLSITSLFSLPVAPLVQRVAACWFAYSVAKVALLATRNVVGVGFENAYGYAAVTAYLGLLSSWALVLWRAQPSDLLAPQPVYVIQGGSGRLAEQLEAVNRSLSRVLKV